MATASSSSALVSAITRASIRSVSVPPSRSNVRSSSTRKSFACITDESAATSSRIDRAAERHLETPGLARDGAGERPAFVTEEFRFHQLGGQAGAIDFQEWRVVAGTVLVNPARELVFTGAALAGDQKRGRRFGKLSRDFEDALGGRIGGDPDDLRGAHR